MGNKQQEEKSVQHAQDNKNNRRVRNACWLIFFQLLLQNWLSYLFMLSSKLVFEDMQLSIT